jgi:xanthine/uracil/vitamin C permease (AzgA family)
VFHPRAASSTVAPELRAGLTTLMVMADIGVGIGLGAYVATKRLRGKVSEIHPLMAAVSVLFLVYFIRGAR